MATPITNAREYCALLSRSRLLPADEVESVYRKWREDPAATDESVDLFRRFLVSKRHLTDYQAAMLQRGHADGFFLGGYKILDRIGKGQMAGVYRAVHSLGQTVALKILPSSKAKNSAILSRFEREARLLTQIRHPNVIRAFQLGETGGIHFIVMEYVDGETLEDVLGRRKKLPVTEAVRLLHQAFNGLQHLHEKRMIHRDMKPANLMLTPPTSAGKADMTWDATVKIVDIGLGRELFDDKAPEAQVETQLTVEGAVLGTPDYLAPEQARDARSADIRADIYSLGCVLYHCLSGKPPFPDTNIMAQMVKHATEPPKPISAFVPDAPKGFQGVLDRLLAKDAAERYATPAAAAKALEPFLKSNLGAKPAGPEMVPAYREWLESTSMTELPKEGREPTPPRPAPAMKSPSKPPTGPKPALRSSAAPKPVSPLAAPQPAAIPEPSPYAVPQPYSAPPTYPAAYPQNPPGYPPAAPYPAAAPGYPGAMPTGYPQPTAAYAPLPVDDMGIVEVDVEEVIEPMPLPAAPVAMPQPIAFDEPMPLAPPPRFAPEEARPIWDLNRRDFIMLGSGGLGVLLAVGGGFGLAQLFRRSKPATPETPEEPKE